MNTTSGPPLPPLPHGAHLLAPLIERFQREPASVLAARRVGDQFVDVTVAEVFASVRRVAKGFIASGVQVGDRVALMSHTRLEWTILDYAILAAGGVTVPIYDTSSPDQIHWIIEDSGAVMCVVETPAMLADFEQIRPDLNGCREALVIDQGGIEELERRGVTMPDSDLEARIATLDVDSIATIIYTSGTTGRPKGCMLTHGNLRINAAQVLDALGPELRPDDTGLLFLPLAHALTKGNALFDAAAGISLGFATDIAHLPEELQSFRPTTMAAVPRIFEKVYNTARNKATRERKGKIFDYASAVAIRWSRERTAGRIWPWTSVEHLLFDSLVYGKLRHAFGGRLRLCFSGGGPLGERLTHFFAGVGVQIYEGYGLTETSPTLTLNRPGAWRPGTVGRPLAGTSIRIADDGEILAKGPQVFPGYWHNDQATAEVFDDDGWFRTGDIGELDDDGYLRITGRKKELIVTAAGKNVAPALLEDHLRAHELISQAVVVGDARPFIAALITIDSTALPDWALVHGHHNVAPPDLIESADLRAAIQQAVDAANSTVSRPESIREFAILPRDLTIESGELTATLKVRRAVVEKLYADYIDRIYAG
ncbi:MAG TPA: long-chain fatty acid--CoA ligase [Ilumatobacteraceae bacterium]